MFTKARFLLGLVSLSICLCLMSSTYSRYVADTTSNIELLFAKWQILVNNTDITTNLESNISFTPVIEPNDNVAADVLAPSSRGHFDIDIDPTNVEVSFKYSIDIDIDNENIPDLIITEYAIVPADYIDGDPLQLIEAEEDFITNTLYFDNNTELFQFETFTIRIYFEWYEGEEELMSDEDDTVIGFLAATEGLTFTITANISFEQIIE